MLGESILDPEGLDGPAKTNGLGFKGNNQNGSQKTMRKVGRAASPLG